MIEFAYNDHLHSSIGIIHSIFCIVRNVKLPFYFLFLILNLKAFMT